MTYLARLLAVALTLALCTSTAFAAPPVSDADRAVAVALVVEGRARLDAGQFAAALELFKRAHAIMHAPTTGLDVAKAHAGLFQLVEARKAADEVVRMPVEPKEKPIFAEARTEAKEAVEALDSRIPLLQLHIIGPSVQVAHVVIDGKTLTPAEVDKPYAANPGSHTIVVTAPDYQQAQVTALLVESNTTQVDVTLKAAVPTPPPPPKDAAVKQNAVPPLAIAGFAVGGGLLVTSAITGILSNVASQNAADALPANGCTPIDTCRTTFYQQVDRGRAFGVVALASLGVGVGVGVASLIYTLKAPKAADTAKAKPSWIVSPTPGGIVVQGAW